MYNKKVIVSACDYKLYRFVIGILILAASGVLIFTKYPHIRIFDWILCAVMFLVALSQFAMFLGVADCFIEESKSFLGIKLVDERKPVKIEKTKIKSIAFLPERQFEINIDEGKYLFKYRDLKDFEITIVENFLTNFANENNIKLKK